MLQCSSLIKNKAGAVFGAARVCLSDLLDFPKDTFSSATAAHAKNLLFPRAPPESLRIHEMLSVLQKHAP